MEDTVRVQEGHGAGYVVGHGQHCHRVHAPAAAVELAALNRRLHTTSFQTFEFLELSLTSFHGMSADALSKQVNTGGLICTESEALSQQLPGF